jgi:LysM repeat protein
MEDQDNNQMGSAEPPQQTYTVLPGDTLMGISIKLGKSVNIIKKLNHLYGKNDLFVGQVIIYMSSVLIYLI